MQAVGGTLVARRILVQVLLMIIFGVPPLPSLDDLGGNLLALEYHELCEGHTTT